MVDSTWLSLLTKWRRAADAPLVTGFAKVSGCLNAGGMIEQPETVPALLRLAGKPCSGF